jgi:hypothetical protein
MLQGTLEFDIGQGRGLQGDTEIEAYAIISWGAGRWTCVAERLWQRVILATQWSLDRGGTVWSVCAVLSTVWLRTSGRMSVLAEYWWQLWMKTLLRSCYGMHCKACDLWCEAPSVADDFSGSMASSGLFLCPVHVYLRTFGCVLC